MFGYQEYQQWYSNNPKFAKFRHEGVFAAHYIYVPRERLNEEVPFLFGRCSQPSRLLLLVSFSSITSIQLSELTFCRSSAADTKTQTRYKTRRVRRIGMSLRTYPLLFSILFLNADWGSLMFFFFLFSSVLQCDEERKKLREERNRVCVLLRCRVFPATRDSYSDPELGVIARRGGRGGYAGRRLGREWPLMTMITGR